MATLQPIISPIPQLLPVTLLLTTVRILRMVHPKSDIITKALHPTNNISPEATAHLTAIAANRHLDNGDSLHHSNMERQDMERRTSNQPIPNLHTDRGRMDNLPRGTNIPVMAPGTE